MPTEGNNQTNQTAPVTTPIATAQNFPSVAPTMASPSTPANTAAAETPKAKKGSFSAATWVIVLIVGIGAIVCVYMFTKKFSKNSQQAAESIAEQQTNVNNDTTTTVHQASTTVEPAVVDLNDPDALIDEELEELIDEEELDDEEIDETLLADDLILEEELDEVFDEMDIVPPSTPAPTNNLTR